MSERIEKQLKNRSTKRYISGISFILLLLVVWWMGNSFVTAGNQTETIYIFPTAVVSEGWQGESAALTQELAPLAPYTDFSDENSSYIFIHGAQPELGIEESEIVVTPVETEATTTQATTTPDEMTATSTQTFESQATTTASTTESAESSGEEGSETVASSTEEVVPDEPQVLEQATTTEKTASPVEEESASATSSEEVVEGSGETTASVWRRAVQGVRAVLLPEALATTTGEDMSTTTEEVAPEGVASTTASTTDSGEEIPTSDPGESAPEEVATVADAPEVEDVTSCAITGADCYHMEFTGFGVTGVTDAPIERMQLNVSFASFLEKSGELDSLAIKYYHNGFWHLAGEFTLDGRTSNLLNDGYFSYVLPEFSSWDELNDLRVSVEYNRQGTAGAKLFLDGVWLEAVYEVPGATLFGGAEESEVAGGDNVQSALHGENTPTTLALEDQVVIDFPYTDDNTGETLIIRSDAKEYVGLDSEEVYFSITNTSDSIETFTLQLYLPAGLGGIDSLEKRVRNIPVEKTVRTDGDVAYFCDSSWEATTTPSGVGEYFCAATGEVKACDALSESQDNCTVANEIIGETVEQEYTEGWMALSYASGVPIEKSDGVLGAMADLFGGDPDATVDTSAFDALLVNEEQTIGVGQTLYYKMVLSYPIHSQGEFLVEAVGTGAYGLLDPWWESDWGYVQEIVVAHPESGEARLVERQMAIILDESLGDFWNRVKKDGSDLRITTSDARVEIPFWIEKWDTTTKEGVVWVKMPEWPVGEDLVLELYHGSKKATPQSDLLSTFTYRTPHQVAYVSGEDGVDAMIRVTSLVDDNTIFFGGESVTLKKAGEATAFTVDALGGGLESDGPVSVSPAQLPEVIFIDTVANSYLWESSQYYAITPGGHGMRFGAARELPQKKAALSTKPLEDTFKKEVGLGEKELMKRSLAMPKLHTLLSEATDFSADEDMVFTFEYQSQKGLLKKVFGGDDGFSIKSVTLVHETAGLVPVPFTVERGAGTQWTVRVPRGEDMIPGKYKLQIEIEEGGEIYVDSLDFYWGVLTINANKAEYVLGETAYVQMAALTDTGNTICDANLVLEITDPTLATDLVEVSTSGKCDGNNVIDVPDYFAFYTPSILGDYQMVVTHLDEAGELLHRAVNSFEVVEGRDFDIERTGPTRIYPGAPYTMTLTVRPTNDFVGTITERVPADFILLGSEGTREYTRLASGDISWDVSIAAGDSIQLTYLFDAPDRSPYVYLLGPLEMSVDGSPVYTEPRSWQIASDATGNMLIFWDNSGFIPVGWSCVSCASTSTFYQKFIVGSSTYGTSGGTSTHTHTFSSSFYTSSDADGENWSGTTIAGVSHTHTLTPVLSTESNLPEYRELLVLQYDTIGAPATLPAGAIVIFDGTLPGGWTQVAEQNGRYVRAESTASTTGGSNTHAHTITGTTSAASGSTFGNRGGGTQTTVATADHYHTLSTSTLTLDNQPEYLEVIFGKVTATSSLPEGMIAMWSDDPDTGWQRVSDDGDDFSEKFIKGANTYGGTNGTTTHAHADVTSAPTTGPVGTINARTGASGASDTHTHGVDVTNFSDENNAPPYVTVVFAKYQGANPIFTQHAYRWYANVAAQTPTDPWPSGATDLFENEPVSATSTPVKSGDVIRLRMNVGVANATTTATSTVFKLQFAEKVTSCSVIGSWTDVGQIASSTIWRGYSNGGVSDGSTLSSTTLSATDIGQSYEEENNSTSTPYQIGVGEYGEWDWVLYQNTATSSTEYCFRMTYPDGTPLDGYTNYPTLYTNSEPEIPTLSEPFEHEKVASTSPWFEFITTDDENENVHYQIQVSTDHLFSTTTIDRNTEDDSSLFANLDVPNDKVPFNHNNDIRFIPATSLTNGTTYWWRVRARDPDGSTMWSDWSTVRALTVDTTVTISTWFQTTEEQFDTGTHSGTDAVAADQVELATGSSTGSFRGPAIDFDWKTTGTIWGALDWNDTETTGDIKYKVEYFSATSTWMLIPDADLSGNSAGFDTTHVVLEGLDTDIYNVIRIRADFDDLTVATPSLQDWTVTWATRVETPVLQKLFDNEKTGTTTPSFEFYTTDPQNDDLTYQISWSTSTAFTASTTRTSDTHAGFINTTDGGDLDPFDTGEVIRFTVQPGDALTDTETYWWRVRAKDPLGGNSWSLWSDPYSFTASSTTIVSTWFQTTDEQFDTGTHSGTYSIGDGVTVATSTGNAMIAYGEGTVQTPRYRLWNGSSWGSELSAQSVGAQINWTVLRAGVTRDEYILGTIGTDNDVNVQVYADGAWGNLQEMTASLSNSAARGFDIAYESTSGDALVVYCDGDSNPSYREWNGSTWGTPGSITTASAINCEWIKLASDPTSDEIIMLTRDDGTGYEAQVWSGSGWGNSTTLGSMSESAHEGMDVMYEESGGQAIIITSNGNAPSAAYNTWNGTTWGTAGTVSLGDDYEWGTLKRDDGTDNIAFCYVDHDSDVGVVEWSGTAWGTYTELDAGGNAKTDRPVDCEYETTTGRDGYIMASYSDTTNGRYQFWNGSTWSGEGSVSTITDSATVQSRRTGDGKILSVFFDDVNGNYDFSYWNGTSWSTVQTLETSASVTVTPYHEPFMIAAQNPQTLGTLTAPSVDFDDGLGPYWQEVTWTDTEAGGSSILYQVEYLNATGTWQLIPDSEIPNNSTGTSTGPINLSNLLVSTYNEIRLVANMTCNGTSCPELQDWTITWAEGITVAGSIKEYDLVTNVTSGTVQVAVNGSLQVGKSGTISAGAWSIPNVTVFTDDIITVYVNTATTSAVAVGVTKYDGLFDVSGMELFERHVSLGSNDQPTLENADLALYDNSVSGDPDVFHDVTALNDLEVCDAAISSCSDAGLYIGSSTTYRPDDLSSGNVTTHDVRIEGACIADGNTMYVSGSWDNNASFASDTGTVVFTATSTTETIDSTGAATSSFNTVTFGQGSGTAIWQLASDIDINGNTTIAFGTFDVNGANTPYFAGDLDIGAGGAFTKGTSTTTFDGSGVSVWSDSTAIKQDLGKVLVDGTTKTVQLGSDVAATDITIGANDTLDASASSHGMTIWGEWTNNNVFNAQAGTVTFAATSSGNIITPGDSVFYGLVFDGAGGGWSFAGGSASTTNLTINDGTLTLPASLGVSGSFTNTAGSFLHSNGTVHFLATAGGNTIQASSSDFYNLTFNGIGGAWSILDVTATSTNDVYLNAGTLTMPSGTLTVGGSFDNVGGAITHNSGMLKLSATGAGESLTFGSGPLYDLLVDGVGGEWTIGDTSATLAHDLTIVNGSLVLPTTQLAVGGSFTNSDTFTAGSGQVLFNATAGGNTIDPGASLFNDVLFNSASGGWSVVGHATSSGDWNLSDVGTFAVNAGVVLEVGGLFTNGLAAASTTWSGSTLYLSGTGAQTINATSSEGDRYDTLLIGTSSDVEMWNASATTTVISGNTGSLYSMDHAGSDGDLYIWGDKRLSGGNHFWSYATDFDGTDLSGGSERQANVRFADNATTTVEYGSLSVVGASAASTTIANQGAGSFGVVINNASTTWNYYDVANAEANGVQFLGTSTVSSLSYGHFEVDTNGYAAMSVASTTVFTNDALQIWNVGFATTTGISTGINVSLFGTTSAQWWFRSHYGDIDGEDWDSDSGSPGEIKWDDSDLSITVSGTVFANTGGPIGNPPCDGVSQVVRVRVDGGGNHTGSCNAGTGAYAVSGVTFTGDVVLTTYLDTAGGARAVTVTKTPSGDIPDMHLYEDRLIVRHENIDPMTIVDLDQYDKGDDPDILFTATVGSPNTLVLDGNSELLIHASSTFSPDGNVTLNSAGTANSWDGSLHIDNNGTYIARGGEVISVGGTWRADDGTTFTASTSSVLFTATSTGHSIIPKSPFYDVTTTGSGGWAVSSSTTIINDLLVQSGVLSGDSDITVQNGVILGEGVIAMTAGTVSAQGTGNFGGNSDWSFYNLSFGNGATSATSTKIGSSTVTVRGVLTITNSGILHAASSTWVLAGGGTPFVNNGYWNPDTSLVWYAAPVAADITSGNYYDLLLAATTSNPTYTFQSGIVSVANDLTVGNGTAPVSVTLNTNDPEIGISGDVTIRANATTTASDSATTTVAGSWLNQGVFEHSGGEVIFDSTDTGETIDAGNSAFGNITFNSSTGGWTVVDHATSSSSWTLSDADNFTATSGAVIEVGGTFTNDLDAASTTWTGSTLYLSSGYSYTMNTKANGGDTYDTIAVTSGTQPRMWDSSAVSYDVSGSLYSMDHTGTNGDLYIWGGYTRSAGADYWNYATDFDGADLTGGSERQVDVRIADSGSVTILGGSLHIVGSSTASTTVDNQGSGTYGITINGGNINATYYSVRNMDTDGLEIIGSSVVSELEYGDFEMSADGGSMIKTTGTVINNSPLLTFLRMRFATSTGVSSGYNVSVSGSSVSSWRMNQHYGNYDGESFDNDPGGNPGYVIWDDSDALITVSGNVYSDEGSTVHGTCDGTTNNVRIRVGDGTTARHASSTPCNASTGAYSFSNIGFAAGDVITVWFDTNGGAKATNVSYDPITNIADMHLYEDRLIVRHEQGSAITNTLLGTYDSDNDTDILFTANAGNLTLDAGSKLILWQNKTLIPGGDITLDPIGNGTAWDGTLELQEGATLNAAGNQNHTIGGSWIAGTSSAFIAANTTVDFTATTTGHIVDPEDSAFYDVDFSGGGSWTFTGAHATTSNDFVITDGSVALPAGVFAVGGSFDNTGGVLDANDGTLVMYSTAAGKTIELGGYDLGELVFAGSGGEWTFVDVDATTTRSTSISAGTVVMPSGTLTVGNSFNNSSGAFTHSSGTIKLTSTSSGEQIEGGGSLFGSIHFAGSGEWTFQDLHATTTADVTIDSGSVIFPTGTFTIGESLVNNGYFTHAIGTVTFNAGSTGHNVDVSTSTFFNVVFDGALGGWTIGDSATSTNDWTINAAQSFTVSSGNRVEVYGEFTNLVGGTATDWDGTTLYLSSNSAYTTNTKTTSTENYDTLIIASSSDIRMWNSVGTTTQVSSDSSLYSMDHAGANGDLYIWGDYVRTGGADYWSYATDFDGADLTGGSERQVDVRIANGATTSFAGGTIEILGTGAATTTMHNQGSGSYAFQVNNGTLNALYYEVRNTNLLGWELLGTTTVTSLDYGDFELSANGGAMISVASTTIDQNATKVIVGNRFATSTGISSGYNVSRLGTSTSAWTFNYHYGNYDGESFDDDGWDGCGLIRWDDSTCLFVSQEHYRWRNDDGGEGVPSAGWLDTDWSKRKRIIVDNTTATALTDFQITFDVTYDSDMQNDFDDLRFTDSSGTTTLNYWIESYIASATSTVWVTVPSIPASDSADIYMYYGNSGVVTTGSATGTFIAFDDFEDGNISEYSGDTSLFNVGTAYNYEGTYGLDTSGNESAQTTDGIYRTDMTVSQGERIRFYQYVDTSGGSGDEPCTLFGVQTPGSNNQNYAVCLDIFGTDQIVLAKDVSSNDGSGTSLATKNVTYSTGWHEVVIDWFTDDSIDVTVYTSSGSLLGTTTATDSSYSSGGIGFSFWYMNTGWDYYTSQKYASSDPTISIQEEQANAGATWKAAEDTSVSVNSGENVRLRFALANTGPAQSGLAYRLQVADKSTYPSCESVPYAQYADVTTTSGGCGTSPACMTTSPNFTNKAPTSQLLSIPDSLTFQTAEIIEDPSNETSSTTLSQDKQTDIEFNFQLTAYATSSNYCFRASDEGGDLDNYARIAELAVVHAPSISGFTFNNNNSIALIEGTTAQITATATITDLNGWDDISFATSSIYRSGLGASCTDNLNNCYQVGTSSCTFSSCSGTSCLVTCVADIQYFAEPTDPGSAYAGETWEAVLAVADSIGERDITTPAPEELLTLHALDVVQDIDYGTLNAGSDTASTNATTTLENTGNDNIDIQLDGTDLTYGVSSIAVNNQKYATSTFSYAACSICQFLTGTSTTYEVDLPKPTSTTTISDDLYWGIFVPAGVAGATHTGVNTFIATGD